MTSLIMTSYRTLTSDEHDTDREDLLGIGVWRHVTKAHTGQTAECEIESCYVLGLQRWTTFGRVVGIVRL